MAVAKIPFMGEMLMRGIKEALKGFDDAEREVLIEMLQRIIANLEEVTRPERGRGTRSFLARSQSPFPRPLPDCHASPREISTD